MIGGWAATQMFPVSIEFVRTMGEDFTLSYISQMASGDWLIRGPRGGRYIADADQETRWVLDKEQFFHSGEWRYLGHRKSIRYIRPGTREALRFEAE